MVDSSSILFLLRSYNDIDHIVPVIWKASVSGWLTYILFVEQDYSDDYRIRFVLAQGATLLQGRPVLWYQTYLRRFLVFKIIKWLADRLVAYSFGLYFLVRYKIQVTVNEWSGPYGRGRAEYYLRAASLLKIPTYSLPHGYFLWINPFFNKEVSKYYEEKGFFPSFRNRNWFSRYVVLSPEHKSTNITYGMAAEKLIVMGSARFCPEWLSLNKERTPEINKFHTNKQKCHLLFFVPDWEYNVDREACVSLLERLSKEKNVFLRIKANTRGTGALTTVEKNSFKVKQTALDL